MIINFKKIRDSEYQMYRVIQAPSHWSAMYRAKINYIGKYRSAIIFPEMLLSLNQKDIFQVIINPRNVDSLGIQLVINPIRAYKIGTTISGYHLPFETLSEILEYEEKYNNVQQMMHFNLEEGSIFFLVNLFSNMEDAKKFANSAISKL